jgi:hypothetical protein
MVVIFTTLLAAEEARAQDPLWQAYYWDNRDLDGEPILQRSENSINYNWGDSAPTGVDIDNDTFSARWVGFISFRPATYRFTTVSDDGVRVWIDGELIIDAWNDHPLQTLTADRSLSAGTHQIVVEYYENEGGAVIQFGWAPAPPANGDTWRGEYYNNLGLGGPPVLVREDPAIGFNWGNLSPGPGVNPDRFSVRWTRTVNLPAGNYRFTMRVDDGGRLWVNGWLLIDAWQVQSPRTYSTDIYLAGGPASLRMEYFDDGLDALAQLSWTRTDEFTAAPPLAPTPTSQFPVSASRPPGIESCLIYPRPNGGFVDPNLDSAGIQQCEQLIEEDAG